MDWKLQRRIERALDKAERARAERKTQLLVEILSLVPGQDKALEALADSTIENLETLVRKLRQLQRVAK